jgi:hypothetical protein
MIVSSFTPRIPSLYHLQIVAGLTGLSFRSRGNRFAAAVKLMIDSVAMFIDIRISRKWWQSFPLFKGSATQFARSI